MPRVAPIDVRCRMCRMAPGSPCVPYGTMDRPDRATPHRLRRVDAALVSLRRAV